MTSREGSGAFFAKIGYNERLVSFLVEINMNNHDIDKAYVSPIDRFLYQFDVTHDVSESQRMEIEKFQRIFALRDNVSTDDPQATLWQEF